MSALCQVRDGRFVDPCSALLKITGRVVEHQQWFNHKIRTPSRSFVTIKAGDHQRTGIVLNFCPFCGTRIDAAVADETE